MAQPVVSVADLFRTTMLGDPQALDRSAGSPERLSLRPPVLPVTPDEQNTAVVITSGDPHAQTRRSTIAVCSIGIGARRVPACKELTTVSFSSGLYQPIAYVRWRSDNRSLTFVGSEGENFPQIYEADHVTGEVRPATALKTRLHWYDTTSTGGHFLTLSQSQQLAVANDPTCKMFGCRVTARSLTDSRTGIAAERRLEARIFDRGDLTGRLLPDLEGADRRIHFCDAEFAGGVSPDGRHALRFCRFFAHEVPAEWGRYRMHSIFGSALPDNARPWRVGFVVDLKSCAAARWSSGPSPLTYLSTAPIWIDGGARAILPAALEALEGLSP